MTKQSNASADWAVRESTTPQNLAPLDSGRLSAISNSENPAEDPDMVGKIPTTESRRVQRARLEALGVRAIPPRPDASLIKAVRTPSPPKVAPTATDQEAAATLLATYWGMVDTKWPGIKRARKPGDPRKNKSYKALVRAAHVMREEGIAPSSWCLFSADAWRAAALTEGPPTVAFVFSENRLRERLDWFAESEANYDGHTVIYSPEWMHLASLHREMWRHLTRENPENRLRLLEVVDRFFPGDTYDRLLDRARNAQAKLQRDVDAMIARGVIFWAL